MATPVQTPDVEEKTEEEQIQALANISWYPVTSPPPPKETPKEEEWNEEEEIQALITKYPHLTLSDIKGITEDVRVAIRYLKRNRGDYMEAVYDYCMMN